MAIKNYEPPSFKKSAEELAQLIDKTIIIWDYHTKLNELFHTEQTVINYSFTEEGEHFSILTSSGVLIKQLNEIIEFPIKIMIKTAHSKNSGFNYYTFDAPED